MGAYVNESIRLRPELVPLLAFGADWTDFGEVVYNLIKIGEMSKSPGDSREHFDDVYDFEQALLHDFAITPTKEMVK